MTTDFFGDDYEPPKVWTLADIYKDLICTQDIAKLLDVNPPRVQLWIKKRKVNKCPKPIRSWPRFDLYSAEEWRTWYAIFLKKHAHILSFNPSKPYGSGQPFFTQEFDEY